MRNYTKMRISGEAGEPRERIRRRWLGEVSIDELAFGYDMSFDADPLGRVMLCRVHQGRIEQKVTGAEQDVFAPGDLMLISPPDLPHGGRVCHVGYDLTGFDPTMLDRVATSAPDDGGSVRLTSHRPVSLAAARRLSAYIDYLRDHVLPDPAASVSQLIIGSAASHLAEATLHAFSEQRDPGSHADGPPGRRQTGPAAAGHGLHRRQRGHRHRARRHSRPRLSDPARPAVHVQAAPGLHPDGVPAPGPAALRAPRAHRLQSRDGHGDPDRQQVGLRPHRQVRHLLPAGVRPVAARHAARFNPR